MHPLDEDRLEDLALLVDVRLRRRHVRGGVEARLRYAGRKAKLILPEEAMEWSFPDALADLLDGEAEVAAARDDEERWTDLQDPTLPASDLRERWRRLHANAVGLRTLLGPDLARFAAAERPPPDVHPPVRPSSGLGPAGFRYPWAP